MEENPIVSAGLVDSKAKKKHRKKPEKLAAPAEKSSDVTAEAGFESKATFPVTNGNSKQNYKQKEHNQKQQQPQRHKNSNEQKQKQQQPQQPHQQQQPLPLPPQQPQQQPQTALLKLQQQKQQEHKNSKNKDKIAITLKQPKERAPRPPSKVYYKVVIRKLPATDFTKDDFIKNLHRVFALLELPTSAVRVLHYLQGKESRSRGTLGSAGYVSFEDEGIMRKFILLVPSKVPFILGDEGTEMLQPNILRTLYQKTLKPRYLLRF